MSVNIGLLLLIFGIFTTILIIRLILAESDSDSNSEEEPNALTEFRKRMGMDD